MMRAVWSRHRTSIVVVSVALLFALAARLPYFVRSNFPLNDGGMFYAMSKDILDAHFSLPLYTSYNGEFIPFAYPPLSFYAVSAISWATGLPIIALVRYLPLAANLGTVVAVYILARAVMGKGWAAYLAPTIFALIPRSYEWTIMGGGLTRSFGFLFAILCLAQARSAYKDPTTRRILISGALGAAALASHLEMGLLVVYSLVLMAFVYGRSLRAVGTVYLIGILMVGLTAPWWATVISRHGLVPFDSASLTSGWSTLGADFETMRGNMFESGAFLSALGILAVLGMVASLIRGDLFLPLWLPAIYVWLPRSSPTEAAIPLALLSAIGIADVVAPGMASVLNRARRSRVPAVVDATAQQMAQPAYSLWAIDAVGIVLLAAAVYLYSPRSHLDPQVLDSLSPGNQQAMAWVSRNTPEDAQFLVLSTTWTWEQDLVGEWFPVIAGRRNVLTVQGTEWLPNEAFSREQCTYYNVRYLPFQGKSIDDLDEWARNRGISYSYIYVSKQPQANIDWTDIVQSAARDPNYTLLIDTPSAAVLKRGQPLEPLWAPPRQLLVASDCETFADQPAATQSVYAVAYGQQAAWAWVDQHEKTLAKPLSLCGRLSRFGFAASLCGGGGTAPSSASLTPSVESAAPGP